jgi:uncharacterized protein (DUF1697 family)
VHGAIPSVRDGTERYRYDVGFYVGVTADDVQPHMSVDPEVDEVAHGERAFYHRRISALASRTRLTRIMSTPIYASLTLRKRRTTTSLAGMLEQR